MKLYPLLSMTLSSLIPMIVSFILPSCSREDPRAAPSKSVIESKVKTTIPAFLSVTFVDSEVIPDSANRLKINFRAKVKSLEDLYIQDRTAQGELSMIILKVSQSNGTEARLYGSMYAERTMDQWNISHPEIDSGLEQLGRPRGSFDSRAMIDGSDELKEFIAECEIKRVAQTKAEEEQRKKNEEARVALVEQKRLEYEAFHQKLIEATAPGKVYQGILVESPGEFNEVRQTVALQFTSQKGTLITAEIHNPDQVEHKQTFSGEVVMELDPGKYDSKTKHFPIILSPKNALGKRVSENERDRFRIYFEECVVKLDLTENGLEGEAYANQSNSKFGLRLKLAQ